MTKEEKIKDRSKQAQALPAERSLLGKFYASLGFSLARLLAKITYLGQENLPTEPPYVLAPNHQTYIDGLLVAKGLPKGHFEKFSAMIGSDLKTDHGWLGKTMQPVSRGIEVDRHGGNPVRGLVKAYRACRAGNIMMVHPEGTRTHDGLVAPLLSGASYIAIKSKVPLIPVYIEGGFEFFSRFDKWPRLKNPLTGKRCQVNIIYGPPLNPDDYEDAAALTHAIEDWLKEKEADYLQKNAGQLRRDFK